MLKSQRVIRGGCSFSRRASNFWGTMDKLILVSSISPSLGRTCIINLYRNNLWGLSPQPMGNSCCNRTNPIKSASFAVHISLP
nr:hypothetical protein Q903MT_gene1426 [Picea sitchensis]